MRQGSSWIAVAVVAAMLVTPLAAKLGNDSAGWGIETAPLSHVSRPATDLLLKPASGTVRRLAGAGKIAPPRPTPALLVQVAGDMQVRARPNANSPVVGVVPSGSKYYRIPTTAWVRATSPDGEWGLVQVPYKSPARNGWIKMRGLRRARTWIVVHVDLSAHRLTVTKAGRELFSYRAATGAASTPTPPGRYFVTDKIPFWRGSALGSFAFGISGIQPRLPAGWRGGDQLAIHGTNDPSSIGTSASAGCVRVSETALARLKALLRLGTPVIITP